MLAKNLSMSRTVDKNVKKSFYLTCSFFYLSNRVFNFCWKIKHRGGRTGLLGKRGVPWAPSALLSGTLAALRSLGPCFLCDENKPPDAPPRLESLCVSEKIKALCTLICAHTRHRMQICLWHCCEWTIQFWKPICLLCDNKKRMYSRKSEESRKLQ